MKTIALVMLLLASSMNAHANGLCGKAQSVIFFENGTVSLTIALKDGSFLRAPIKKEAISTINLALQESTLEVCGEESHDSSKVFSQIEIRKP
ncbi:MAG: hypothetical protein KA715_01245 [Xanthomonadaceae bacterium]|nr:hypothetical protein [Xanthomonadaceae bacterium]